MVRAQQVSDTCPLHDIGLLILKANGPPHPTPASMHLDEASRVGWHRAARGGSFALCSNNPDISDTRPQLAQF